MIPRRPARRGSPDPASPLVLHEFHAWVTSLPWVVERPDAAVPDARVFGVDCEPLGRRRLWLVTGLRKHLGVADIAVIVPDDAAAAIEAVGWASRWAQLPANHFLMVANDEAAREHREIEALAIAAYSYAMA
jgi:hypothetical protein